MFLPFSFGDTKFSTSGTFGRTNFLLKFPAKLLCFGEKAVSGRQCDCGCNILAVKN